VDQLPDSRLLPITQAPPAGHAGAAPQFLRQHFPGNAATQHEQNAHQAHFVCQTRSAALGLRLGGRDEGYYQLPQLVQARVQPPLDNPLESKDVGAARVGCRENAGLVRSTKEGIWQPQECLNQPLTTP
jgi:hypothetical protein